MTQKARGSIEAAHSNQAGRATLAARLKDASTRLHDALMNGHDTAGIRRELQEINTAEVWIALEISEREAAQNLVQDGVIRLAAQAISAEAIARLDLIVSDLSPPEQPIFRTGE